MAMDFRGANDRVRAMIASKKPPAQLSASALRPDALRDNVIRDVEARTPRFASTVENVPMVPYTDEDGNDKTYRWSTYASAVRDTAKAAWAWEPPELLPPEQMRPSHLFNREVERAVFGSEEFQSAYPYTRGSDLEALYGAMALGKVLQQEAGRVAEHVARSEELQDAEDEQQTAEDMFQELRDLAKQQVQDDGAVDDTTRREIKKALKRLGLANDKIEQLVKELFQSDYVQAAQNIGKKAASEFQKAVETIQRMPGKEPGQETTIPPDKAMDLADKWRSNEDLQKILDQLGRLVTDMSYKRQTRKRGVKIEPVGVTTGRDLDILLPHEFARAFDPVLMPTFVKDYAAHNLLQYEMEGKLPAAKGKIIGIRDGSSSMSGPKFIWATSVLLALSVMANRTKRGFAGIEFGSPGQMKSWEFPATEPLDPDRALEMASHFFRGGTSIETGMREALRMIEDEPGFDSADVILIGDGEDHYGIPDKQIHDKLVDMGVRIHGISILSPNNSYMQAMCEYVVDVIDLAGSNEATDALAENIT